MRRWLVAVGTVLVASACASGGAQRQVTDASLQALHAELDAAGRAYADALDGGGADVADGRPASREAAAARLREAALRCHAAPGCDAGRVVGAYDALLARQAGVAGEGYVLLDDEPETAGESPIVADLPSAGRSVALLKGRDLQELIVLNEPMKAALTEWLTWMRPQLITTWVNYQYMRQLMWPEYERAGLPEALLFGILAKESGGRVHAVSRAGAAGPLQFMPATGLRFGLGNDPAFDTRFDPQLATRANVAYLEERFAQLNNNLELSLAAYNGGEGRVGRLASANPGRDFWDSAIFSQLPAETRDYVPFVMAAAWLFLNAEDYGLEFPRIDPVEPVLLPLERATTLNELAICLGDAGNRDGWFRVLRNLNPRYQTTTPLAAGTHMRVPPRVATLYRQHCLEGQRARMAAELASARKPAVAPAASASSSSGTGTGGGRSYTVQRGDTLGAIAQRHGCGGVARLAQANGLRAPYAIRPGQTLRLTGCAR